ncbi:MAG: hypothetical protein R3E50_12165 [Halioglobus sp.]
MNKLKHIGTHCPAIPTAQLLSLLGLDATLVDVDLAAGEHKQAEFLAKNRFGQVPVLETVTS